MLSFWIFPVQKKSTTHQNTRYAIYIANGVMTALIPEYLVLMGDVSI